MPPPNFRAMSTLGDVLLLRDASLGRWAVIHLGGDTSRDNRLFILQNAASTYDDYVDFLTTYLSLVHVITPDDLVGTNNMIMEKVNNIYIDHFLNFKFVLL